MGVPPEAPMQFISREWEKPAQPLTSVQQGFTPDSDPAAPTPITPLSHPIAANNMKTELQPSAPATLPAELVTTETVQGSSDNALVGGSELSANLTEIAPMSSGTSISAAESAAG